MRLGEEGVRLLDDVKYEKPQCGREWGGTWGGRRGARQAYVIEVHNGYRFVPYFTG